MKILVVDNDRKLQLLYREELEEEGYEVHVAGSGREALEKFERIRPALVTVDITLPDIDGVRLLEQLKDLDPRCPAIILTAYDFFDDSAIWVSDEYMVKSSDLTELKDKIHRFVTAFPAPQRHEKAAEEAA